MMIGCRFPQAGGLPEISRGCAAIGGLAETQGDLYPIVIPSPLAKHQQPMTGRWPALVNAAMPLTFSHPLAVVPLRRFCPAQLNFLALVIGSMLPDFGYYTRQYSLGPYCHTPQGILFVCLPVGFAVLVVFYGLRAPLCYILPQPHRAALTPLAVGRPRRDWRTIIIAVISLVLGACTHVLWDSFTHEDGWAVRHLPALSTPLHFGHTQLPVCYVLQQLSTVGAGLALVILYVLWLRRQPEIPRDTSSDHWRYGLLGGLAVLSLAAAIPSALQLSSHYAGYTAIRVFLFRAGVYATAFYLPLVTVAAVFLHTLRRKFASGPA